MTGDMLGKAWVVIEFETTLRLNQTQSRMWEKLLGAAVVVIQAAGDSCWVALWRSLGQVNRHFCSNRGDVPPFLSEHSQSNHVHSGRSLGDFLARPTDVSVSRHSKSERFSVFWTVRSTWTPSESWDKHCWERPCFRKKKTDQNKKPLIFLSPPNVWVGIITRYQEFADFSLLIVL